MSEQIDLLSFPDPDNEHAALFFALLLRPQDQPDMATFVCERRRTEGLTGIPTPERRLHLSLHAVGEYPELPDRIVRASTMAGAAIDVPAFSVAFDRTMTFAIKRREKPFVLCASDGMTALESLHHQLGEVLWRVGLGRHVSRHFTPHITLLYDRRPVPERPITPVVLRFDEFVLIHSLVRPRRHVHVARWPLRQ